ncbi:MAG: hypothetical protein U1C59_01465 [Methylotenera sp.]|nr:hypothetical protein [Methylotenera sp.]
MIRFMSSPTPNRAFVLATILVGITPFVYFILEPYLDLSSGSSVFLRSIFLGIMFAGTTIPILFIGKSSILIFAILYLMFVLLFLILGFVVVKITKGQQSANIFIVVLAIIYIAIMYLPILAAVSSFP